MVATLTIPGAMVVFQICVSLILFFGVAILSRGYNPEHGIRVQAAKNPTPLLFLILVLMFATLVPVLLTESFTSAWGPVYGLRSHAGLSIDAVKEWVFVIDIIMTSWITSKTGGWKLSPFPSLTFSVPAIAILLGEMALRVAFYTALISIIYGFSLYAGRKLPDDTRSARIEGDVSMWIVTVLTLALTTLIGVTTRHMN